MSRCRLYIDPTVETVSTSGKWQERWKGLYLCWCRPNYDLFQDACWEASVESAEAVYFAVRDFADFRDVAVTLDREEGCVVFDRSGRSRGA